MDDKEREIGRNKEELNVLKARVNEADRGRELIVRELGRAKDEDQEKLREVERTKAAVVKVQEKVVEVLKRDKGDL